MLLGVLNCPLLNSPAVLTLNAHCHIEMVLQASGMLGSQGCLLLTRAALWPSERPSLLLLLPRLQGSRVPRNAVLPPAAIRRLGTRLELLPERGERGLDAPLLLAPDPFPWPAHEVQYHGLRPSGWPLPGAVEERLRQLEHGARKVPLRQPVQLPLLVGRARPIAVRPPAALAVPPPACRVERRTPPGQEVPARLIQANQDEA
mmetsp:Transcript_56482/g.156362  ORF Transcript_56482/g.156362 Transcript_56482/m.156362 type:complete len:203 (-) Transcript_56482:287-895(-)